MAAPLPSSIDFCGVREGRRLIVAGWLFDADDPLVSLGVAFQGRELPASAVRFVRGTRADVSSHFKVTGAGRWGFAIVADLPEEAGAHASFTLLIHTRRRGVRRDALSPQPSAELAGLLLAVAPYTPDEQLRVRAIVPRPGAPSASDLLEAEPTPVESLRSLVRMHVDYAFLPTERDALYVRGWLFDRDRSVVAMHLRVDGAVTENLLPKLSRHPRVDLDEAFRTRSVDPNPGFAAFVPCPIAPAATRTAAMPTIELLLCTRDGEIANVPVTPSESDDLVATARELMALIVPLDRDSYALFAHSTGPALERIVKPRPVRPDEIREHAYGPAPTAPRCTVIVPLYGRYDFVYHQLARFSHDPAMQDADLVYVVDDPALYAPLVVLAESLYPIYGVPFRIVCCGRNLGFAGANNFGAGFARAPWLLLLNSDVLPNEAGFLATMLAHARSRADVGAVGARLLFHDGTIQHDGMSPRRDPTRAGLYWNEHPGKGLVAPYRADEPIVACPLLTGACLMVSKADYDAVSGLDEGYLIGDFEDSDLCLRLRALGRTNYLVRDVSLTHLERQSQTAPGDDLFREKVTLYNAHRFASRWHRELDAMLDATDGASR